LEAPDFGQEVDAEIAMKRIVRSKNESKWQKI
jgi:hypothetical protein